MLQKKAKSISSTRCERTFPFPKEMILQIVGEVESGCSRKKACATYGMAYVTLCEWMGRYGSAGYQSKKKAIFSLRQKRNIIGAIKEKRLTRKEACLAHNINIKVLNSWLLKSMREDEELSRTNNFEMNVNLSTSADACIEKELNQARLKIRALETMIDIAEEHFKISIRKKPGAKQ